MQLRLHHQTQFSGLLLYEVDPQVRTLLTASQINPGCRVAFPYTLFLVRYLKLFDCHKQCIKVLYPGVFGGGLHVFCRNSPLTTLNEPFYTLPSDVNAWVCTNHSLDNTEYDTPRELAKTVISSWYGMEHPGISYPSGINADNKSTKIWGNISLEDICKVSWYSCGASFTQAMQLTSGSNPHFTMRLVLDGIRDDLPLLPRKE